MPVRQGKDKNGHFFQWGDQAKYYFDPKNPADKERARKKAEAQGRAVEANKGKAKGKPKGGFDIKGYNPDKHFLV